MNDSPPIIVWFRADLRLADHAALDAAAEHGASVLPVFILDEKAEGDWAAGGARRWWLHRSLSALSDAIAEAGGRLVLRRGDSARELARLASDSGARAVYCHRRIEPWAAGQERAVHERLAEDSVRVRRFAGQVLFDPEAIRTRDDRPYRVFTPFWKACLKAGEPPPPRPRARVSWLDGVAGEDLDAWRLEPVQPDWAGGLRETWSPGEAGAHQAMERFVDEALDAYPRARNRPDRPGTSRLSPFLHHGEISPRQVWHRVRNAVMGEGRSESAAHAYLRELGWREFSYHLLHHWPDLPEANFRPDFDAFPWREDAAGLAAWQRGRTGYPIVDAGMRELWHTGWMHNRVRMIVASFLVKDLLVHWREGERWFWDTLVDADLANNAASWQWVAGSGADAAPYFRIFNPVRQGEKFDPAGEYVRRWLPEIAGLPDKCLHAPWTASAEVLAEAGLSLGEDYPEPLVDHGEARERALAAYRSARGED